MDFPSEKFSLFDAYLGNKYFMVCLLHSLYLHNPKLTLAFMVILAHLGVKDKLEKESLPYLCIPVQPKNKHKHYKR